MENVPDELMEEALARERADKERINGFIRTLQDGGHLALSSGED